MSDPTVTTTNGDTLTYGPRLVQGPSAYEVAVDEGFVGDEAAWLASIVGDTGDTGDSAYDIAVDGGFVGTETEWIQSLNDAAVADATPLVAQAETAKDEAEAAQAAAEDAQTAAEIARDEAEAALSEVENIPPAFNSPSTTEIRYGLPVGTDPTTGTGSANSTFVIADAASQYEILESVSGFALSAGTLKLKVFDADGTVDRTFSVYPPGSGSDFTYKLGTPVLINPGQRLGWYWGNRIPFVSATSDSGGVFSASGDVDSVSLSGAVTTNRYQISFKTTPLDAVRRDELEAEIESGLASSGSAVADEISDWSGAGLSGDFLRAPFVIGNGAITKLRFYADTLGDGSIKVELRDTDASATLLEEGTVTGLVEGWNDIDVAALTAEWDEHDEWYIYLGGTTSQALVGYRVSGGQHFRVPVNSGATAAHTAQGQRIGIEVEYGNLGLEGRLENLESSLQNKVEFYGSDYWNGVFTIGQSNGRGYNNILGSYAPASTIHKMPNVGMRAEGSTGITGGSNGTTNDGAVAAMVEATDGSGSTGAGDTGIHVTARALTIARAAYSQDRAVLFGCSLAKDGTEQKGIGKGSRYFDFNLLNNLALTQAAADAAEKDFVISGFISLHGESDNQAATPKLEYKQRKIWEIEALNEYASTLPKQENKPFFLFMTTTAVSAGSVQLEEGQVEAVYELAQEYDQCRLLEPSYIMEYNDAVHYGSREIMGRFAAEELTRWELGLPSGAMTIQSAAYDSDNTRVIVTVTGKSAAQFVTTHPNIGTVTDQGFSCADDGSLTITGTVTIGESEALPDGRVATEIYLPVNTAPTTNAVVRYAKDSSGSLGGARKHGTVFDSTSGTWTVNSIDYPRARACHARTLAIYTLEQI